MKILKRFYLRGIPVSVIETEGAIEIESPTVLKNAEVQKYLEDEGILEEILCGNLHFESVEPEGLTSADVAID